VQAQAGRKVEVWWSKSREEPWRAQAASPRPSRSNPNFRGNKGRHNFQSRASRPALFLFFARCCSARYLEKISALYVQDETDVMANSNLIQHSFELAAERCQDLTPLVYHRLFREHPEAEAMFRHEENDLVKGSMLALTIDAMLDFAGDRTGSFRMISCEVQSHDAYGTPRELFGKFFGVIADTMREILGAEWSPEIEDAWRRLLGLIDAFIAQSEILADG
jgi:hemoglobin-like flavoprotein